MNIKQFLISLLHVIMLLTLIGCIGSETGEVNDGRVSIPFEITSKGILVVIVKINGKSANFVLDTGSARSLIDTRHLEYFHLQAQSGSETLKGLGTSNHETMNIAVEQMEIGEVKFDNPSFLATDLSHVGDVDGEKENHGLIGSDILRARGAVVDYGRQILVLNRVERTQIVIQANDPDGIRFKILKAVVSLFQ